MMPETNLAPNRDEIRQHLQTITRRWGGLGEPTQIVLRSHGEGVSHQNGRFSPDDMGIDMAVDWAADMCQLPNRNVYIIINPVRPGTGFGSDVEVICSLYHWADADDERGVGSLRAWAGPKWRKLVRTGTIPSERVHVYWELEQPEYDLARWTSTQSGIADRLATDPAVINPSRIMRLAGTITWPDKRKQARGYVSEVATLMQWPERELVQSDKFARLFTPQHSKPAASSLDFDVSTPESLDRERAIKAALEGDHWHDNVIKIVGSYVTKGLTDSEIHQQTDALTLPGYTVEETRREVQQAIDGARKKGWTPEPSAEPQQRIETGSKSPHHSDPPAAALEIPFTPWAEIDLAAIPPTRFVYSDFYARGYTSVTLAEPKRGKSLLGLAEAIDIATGRGILTGYEREPQTVVYFNAEDDQNVLNARVAALLVHYGIGQNEIAGRLYAQSGVDWNGFFLVHGETGEIREDIFEGLEAFVDKSKADVLIFDPLQDLSDSPETNEVFRRMGRRLRRMATEKQIAIGLIHHTRKVAPGMAPTIDDGRGGSALRGTARFNRILAGMTEDEAVKAGVDNHRYFIRIGDAESNLAPPSSNINRWFRKVSVPIANGEHVGAVEKWQSPDPFEGVTPADAGRVRNAVREAFTADPMSCRADVQAAKWVGVIVAANLGLDIEDKTQKSRVGNLIKRWIESGVLKKAHAFDPDKRTERPVVVPGPNNPEVA